MNTGLRTGGWLNYMNMSMNKMLIIVEVIFNDKGRRISRERSCEEHFVVDHITNYDELCELVFSRLGSEVIDCIQLIKTINLPYEPETIKPGVWREICIYHPSSVPQQESKLVDIESSAAPEFFPWCSKPFYRRFDSLGISVMKLRTLDGIGENNLMIFELIRAPQEQIDEYEEYKDTLEKLRLVKKEIQETMKDDDLIDKLGGKQEIEKLYTRIISANYDRRD